MNFVQEPDDLPKWVVDLERGYELALENFIRAHSTYHEVDKIFKDFYVSGIPLKCDFGDLNNFIDSLARCVVRRCEEEFAPSGTKLSIREELPAHLVVKLSYNHRNPKLWTGDPADFKIREIYKYLAAKYHTTSIVDTVAEQAAEELVDCIGQNALNYTSANPHKRPEYHDANGSLKPFIERFDALHKKTKKVVIYSKRMYEGYSNKDGIIWNSDSARSGVRLMTAMINVYNLIFRGVDVTNDNFKSFAEQIGGCMGAIGAASGGLYPLGHEEGWGGYKAIFRKQALEIHITHDLHERIVKFLAQNLKLKKGK